MSTPNSGTKTLLIGPIGTGKTYCARTFLSAGVTPFVIATEPGISSTLGDLPPDKCHWHYVALASTGWDILIDTADKINRLPFKTLSGLEGLHKQAMDQYKDFLLTCNNFICDRTSESFGDVSSWGPDRALIIDSLTGLNLMAMNLVAGLKPVKSQADWGVAMSNLEFLVNKLVTDTRCYLVVTAHPEREMDEVSGTPSIMPGTLGRKLAPKLPRMFDDVVYCTREADKFSWSTIYPNVDLKARNLPWSAKIEPSFAQIVRANLRKSQPQETKTPSKP